MPQLPAWPADAGRARTWTRPGAAGRLLLGQGPAAGQLRGLALVARRDAAGLQRRPAAADAEAAVDVRAARQVQAGRCQRRTGAVGPGRARRPPRGRAAAPWAVVRVPCGARTSSACPMRPAMPRVTARCRAGCWCSRRRAGARVAGARRRHLALAGGAQRRRAHRGGHGRAVRAADGQPRTGGRRQFPEGLLPRPGGRGAQPVPRHAEAAHAAAGRQRPGRAGPGRDPQRRPRAARRHGGAGRARARRPQRPWPNSSWARSASPASRRPWSRPASCPTPFRATQGLVQGERHVEVFVRP
jgi:hypothetical protein